MASIPIIGEGNPDFNRQATQTELEAVKRAEKAAGIVPVSPDWERTATAEQREARRRESLLREKKGDSELDKSLGEVRAKYKIEVTFVQGRTPKGPNKLGIQIWWSGKHFHGGGDELVFWCKDNRDGENGGCWGIIPPDCIRGEIAVCPHCNRTVISELLTNMKMGNVTSQNLSKELAKLFHELGSNADIFIKYHRTDVHYIAMEREKGPEVAARLKGMHIYPLKNILKDTMAGADLVKRFYAFVTS